MQVPVSIGHHNAAESCAILHIDFQAALLAFFRHRSFLNRGFGEHCRCPGRNLHEGLLFLCFSFFCLLNGDGGNHRVSASHLNRYLSSLRDSVQSDRGIFIGNAHADPDSVYICEGNRTLIGLSFHSRPGSHCHHQSGTGVNFALCQDFIQIVCQGFPVFHRYLLKLRRRPGHLHTHIEHEIASAHIPEVHGCRSVVGGTLP